MRYGKWWRAEGVQEGCLSLGIHIDTRSRKTGREGIPYGPYVDLHLGLWVIGLGRNPVYAGEYDLKASYGRGGLRAEEH